MFTSKKQPVIEPPQYIGTISAASTQPVNLSSDFENGKTQPTSFLPRDLSHLCRTQIDNLYVSSQGFTGSKTQTDDAINTGFVIRSTGKVLPYIAGADGAFRCLSLASTLICNEFFPSIVSNYVEKLSNSSGDHKEIDEIMKELLMEINEEAKRLNDVYSQSDEVCFTFACAISFENNNVTRVASIGLGSDLIAIYRPEEQDGGKYIRLYDATGVIESDVKPAEKVFLPLAIAYSNKKDEKITINEYFEDIIVTNSFLDEGDRLVFLTDGIHNELPTNKEKITRDHNKMLYVFLNPKEVSPEALFQKAIDSIKSKISDASKTPSDKPWDFGDDAAIGIVKVPTAEESRKIIEYATQILIQAKQSTIPALRASKNAQVHNFSQSLVSTMFGHKKRKAAVLIALENSRNIYALHTILKNQIQVFQGGDSIALDDSLLEKRYSSEVKKLKNYDKSSPLPPASQDYLSAIERAKAKLEEFFSALTVHHCGVNIASEYSYDKETNMSMNAAAVEELREQANSVETSTSLQPGNS